MDGGHRNDSNGAMSDKYLVLAREYLTNQIEGRALRSKETSSDVICRYGCVGKIVADRGEMDTNEAKEFFSRMGNQSSYRSPRHIIRKLTGKWNVDMDRL